MLEERAFPGRAEAALSAFHRMMTEIASALKTDSVADILRAVLERTGYRKICWRTRAPRMLRAAWPI